MEKRIKYIPPLEDIDKVISVATKEVQDYLWTIKKTMAHVSEINRLTWDDVNLKNGYVTLYTRKKRGGHLTPRKVWMTATLHKVLNDRANLLADFGKIFSHKSTHEKGLGLCWRNAWFSAARF